MLHIFVLYNNPYLKVNTIVLPPLNNFTYHFINLGFNFIYSFIYILCKSSLLLSCHSISFVLSISFLFCIIPWVLWSFWSNSSPLYKFSCDRIHIWSLICNHDMIHCCVVAVWKLIRDERELVALEIKCIKGGVFFFHAS